MLRRVVVTGTILAVLVAFGTLPARSEGTKTKSTTSSTSSTSTSTTKAKSGASASAVSGIAVNEIAVCGCGKVFVPDASTQYIESGGKKYACCSDGCHKMAMADPAGAAKMADANTAKVMAQLASASAPASAPK